MDELKWLARVAWAVLSLLMLVLWDYFRQIHDPNDEPVEIRKRKHGDNVGFTALMR